MSSLSKSFEPASIEQKTFNFWTENNFFEADSGSKKPPYTIVIPPPNVTGALHMGHALVDTIIDVLIRFKRMQGYEALWVPGTDHAGIATQGVVEKRLFQQTGKRRKDFSREEFLAHVWDWKEKSEGTILGQIKKLGSSCDFSRLRFTMDEGCNKAVKAAFKKLFDQKLIYRGDYLVNWDPVTLTALSDDEVEHEEVQSHLWYIRYPIKDSSQFITVATTRPETMLGDTAVAVSLDDPKHSHLIGKKIILPLTGREIPVIADHAIDPNFGSGAVKITPAHDFLDFEIGKRHNLPFINILNPDATLNESTGIYNKMNIDEARIAIVEELKKLKLLEKIEPHHMRRGISYRSKAQVQPYLSKQWFINMGHFKEKLITAISEKRIKITPEHFEPIYYHWIENLRDWCISRQLWWGHRIPVWYNKLDRNIILCNDEETAPLEVQKNPDLWEQDPDVLDTWFSSALWPLSVLGWPDKTPDFEKFYPTSTLVTAHDILFFWVARMIMMGEHFGPEVPFHNIFLHGLIYGKSYWKTGADGSATYITGDEKKKYDAGEPLGKDVQSKWEKMSKTKGNVIDPIEMIDQYGADAVRFTLCISTTHARQIDLDQRRFEEYKNFANKVWNGARFVLMNVEHLTSEMVSQGLESHLFTLEDKWILSSLNRAIEEINNALEQFHFDKASHRAYEFFWNDFCSTYVELSKPVLFGKTGNDEIKRNKQKLLMIVLVNSCLLLHPFAPFITEEIFQQIKLLFPHVHLRDVDPYSKMLVLNLLKPACCVGSYPSVIDANDINPLIEKEFHFMHEVVRLVRNIRTEMQIPPSEKTNLFIMDGSNSLNYRLINKNSTIITALTPTSHVFFAENPPQEFGATAMIEEIKLFIPIPESLKEKEKTRLVKEKEKLEKQLFSLQSKLANQEFKEKAPKEIVLQLEHNAISLEAQIIEISTKINRM